MRFEEFCMCSGYWLRKRWEEMGRDGRRWEEMGEDGKRWEEMGRDGRSKSPLAS